VNSENISDESSLATDLLYGAKAIGDFIGENESRVYYLTDRGLIPVGHVGALLVGSRRTLREFFEKITAGPSPSPETRIVRRTNRGRR
jgi:hypothetical protein